jgi:hypothetical protein
MTSSISTSKWLSGPSDFVIKILLLLPLSNGSKRSVEKGILGIVRL